MRPDGAGWPADRDGAPMIHLASVDFAALPRLDGFPEAGLLQLFVPEDSLGIGEPGEAPAHRVDCWRDMEAGGPVAPPALPRSRFSGSDLPFASDDVHQRGRGMTARPGTVLPSFDDPLYRQALTAALGPSRDLEEALRDAADIAGLHDGPTTSFLGGHPWFCQCDPRIDEVTGSILPAAAPYDTVLLGLVYDRETLRLGDGGLGMLRIPGPALARCDFSDTWWHWDS